jgi:hypothetical protein
LVSGTNEQASSGGITITSLGKSAHERISGTINAMAFSSTGSVQGAFDVYLCPSQGFVSGCQK